MSEIKLELVDPCFPDDATVRPKLEIFDDETDVKTDPDTFVKVGEDYSLNDSVCDIMHYIRDNRAMLSVRTLIYVASALSRVWLPQKEYKRADATDNELPRTTTLRPPIAF